MLLPSLLIATALLLTPSLALPTFLRESPSSIDTQALIHEIALLENRLTPQGRAKVEALVEGRGDGHGLMEGTPMGVGAAMLEKPSGVWRDKKTNNIVRLADGVIIRGPGASSTATYQPILVPTSVATIAEQHSDLSDAVAALKTATRFVHSLWRGNQDPALTNSFLQQDMHDLTSSLFSSSIDWIPLPLHTHHKGYWELSIDTISIDGSIIDVPETKAAIFDSSSNRIAFSPQIAKEIYDFIPESTLIPSSRTSITTSYSVPCAASIHLTLNLKSTYYPMLPQEFQITPIAAEGMGRCLGAVYGLEILDDEVVGTRNEGREEVLY